MDSLKASKTVANLPEQLIGSVRATAAYELVVEEIKKAIFLGRFVPGDKLPPERDLAEQMLVSRTTVREAIRMLEGEGLVSVKRGACGGLTVLQQKALSLAEIELYIEHQMDELDMLFEFRLTNEVAAARLAAMRRSKADIDKMYMAVDAMDSFCASVQSRAITSNVSRFCAWDSEFHLSIAQASMNQYLMDAVEKARTAMFLPVGKVFTRLEEHANEHHQELLQAIERRNSELAAECMRQHIQETWESLRDLIPGGRKKMIKTQ